MKRLQFRSALPALLMALIVALAVAAVAYAQQPAPFKDIADVIAQGKSFQTAAARDTVWSTTEKPSSVAAAKWRGPIPVYMNVGKGLAQPSEYVLPNAWFLYARKPFNFKGMFLNGDSTGAYHTNVDTMIVNTHNAYSLHLYPCYYLVRGPVRQLRVVPATSDTVYQVPLVIKTWK